MTLGLGGEAEAAGHTGFPLTMQHKSGDTTIPSRPERVVTASFNDADFALALGVVPVGVAGFIGSFPTVPEPAVGTLWSQQAPHSSSASPKRRTTSCSSRSIRALVCSCHWASTCRPRREISGEQADLLDQDVIVVIGTEQELMDADPVFSSLDAVREGRVVYLGGFETEFASVLESR